MTRDLRDTALLVMDVQAGVVDRLEQRQDYLDRVTAAVGVARQAGVRVLHVVVGFRPGMPEVSARNQAFGALKSGAVAMPLEPRPVIAPAPDEPVVVKRRVSAFTGSDLEVLLRAGGIEHLVLAGIATSGVVLSTLREAADKDYRLTVLSDLCADLDAEVHDVLVKKVFPRQASVQASADWLRGLD